MLMAAARDEAISGYFARLMSLTANCHRGEKQRPFTPADFMPKKYRKRTVMQGDIGILKAVFVDGKLPAATSPGR